MSSGIITRSGQDHDVSREQVAASIQCPFSRRRNPLETKLEAALCDWARDSFGPTTAEQLAHWRLAELVTGWYPDADDEHLMIGASYFCWRFVLDDAVDETRLGSSVESLRPLLERLDGVVCDPHAEPEDRFSRALSDVLRRAERGMAASDYQQLRDACSSMLGALLWEAGNRAIGWAPDESAFAMLRPGAAGATVALELVRLLQRVESSAGSSESSDVTGLAALTARIVCRINDLLSYEKESLHGDVHNLVLVLRRRRGLSLKEALWRAVELTNRDIENFVAIERRLAPQMNVQLLSLISNYQSCICTTLDWTYASPRYSKLPTRFAGFAVGPTG